MQCIILAFAALAAAAPQWNDWQSSKCETVYVTQTPEKQVEYSTVYKTEYSTEYKTNTEYKTVEKPYTEYKTEYKTQVSTVTQPAQTVYITPAPVKEYVTKEVYVTETQPCSSKWGNWS